MEKNKEISDIVKGNGFGLKEKGLVTLIALALAAGIASCRKSDFSSGESSYKKGKYEQAISYLQKVDKSDKNYSQAQELLQNTYFELGKRIFLTRQTDRYNEAIGYLKKVGKSNLNYGKVIIFLEALYGSEMLSLKAKMQAPSYINNPAKLKEFETQIKVYEGELEKLLKSEKNNPQQPSSQYRAPKNRLEGMLAYQRRMQKPRKDALYHV